MSCSCTSPCNCSPAPATCCTPTTESVEYTFENGNLVGVGVFDNDTDNLVQFRGIVSDSAALTVTLDAGDKSIILSFDPAALVADIPDATTTQRGILETATNGEAVAKAATDKILTPSNLAAIGASTTFAGLVELATDAETITGTSTTLATTPAGVAAAMALSNTVTFADAVARAAATPSFDGQLGVQLDDDLVYVAVGTNAGDFTQPLLSLSSTNNEVNGPTTIDFPAASDFTFNSLGGGSIVVFDIGAELGNGFDFTVNGNMTFSSTGNLDFQANSSISIASTTMIGNQILGTDSGGSPASLAVADFLSTANVQTGYTTFANPATLRTCDTATVTLPQLAQIVGTLIEDLKAVQLPAT